MGEGVLAAGLNAVEILSLSALNDLMEGENRELQLNDEDAPP